MTAPVRLAACLAVVVSCLAGCGEIHNPYGLASGLYRFTPRFVDDNSCGEETLQSVSNLTTVDYFLQVNDDGGVCLEPTGAIGPLLLVPIFLAENNRALSGGPGRLELDQRQFEEADPDYTGGPGQGDCFVVFESRVTGTVNKRNGFSMDLVIDIYSREVSGCDELSGNDLTFEGFFNDGSNFPVRFPDLSDGDSCRFNTPGHSQADTLFEVNNDACQ